jgi:UDP-N-acetylmuramyl pentapeptide phosphotransferase/UDP-N-acetylglucosamine-1-phosphate transferase
VDPAPPFPQAKRNVNPPRFGYKPGMGAFDTSLQLALLFLICFTASLGLTGLLRRGLAQRRILDRPNERSSHKEPTPRGGGIAVLAVLLPAWFLTSSGLWPQLMGALALAAIGWWDDLKSISPWPRLVVQIAAVALGLWGLYPLSDGQFTGGLLSQPFDAILAGLAWLWFINLFNFMDGMDGIAGGEAVSIGLGLTVIALWIGGFGDLAALSIALIGSVLGFLHWNWHPAKIFLGDVGSQALGYLIGFLLLRTAGDGAWAAALILPLYYWVDATWTLLRRGFARENIFAAHAQHFYQQSLRRGRRHDQVAGAILLANLALVLFALGAEMGERAAALAGAALTVLVLVRRLLRPVEGAISSAERN